MSVIEKAPDAERVKEALKVVIDPEIGINIVELGLVYDVQVSPEGDVHVTYTLTSLGCPLGEMIEGEIRDAVTSMEGVTSVTTQVTFTPTWGPDRMSDFAKSALGFF